MLKPGERFHAHVWCASLIVQTRAQLATAKLALRFSSVKSSIRGLLPSMTAAEEKKSSSSEVTFWLPY